MGFNLDGYVLRPARVAGGNSRSSGEATSGVSRDHVSPAEMSALGYTLLPPRVVAPYADMYRASVLLAPTEEAEQYLVWAATTGSFSTVEDSVFAVIGVSGYVTASKGTLAVTGGYTDGTDTFFVLDPGGRALQEVTVLQIKSGVSVVTASFTQDALTGRVVLDSATLTSLGGGFSPDRGDSAFSVSYILASPKFWWSRNDARVTRFGWDGRHSRWAPLRGESPQNLGAIQAGTSYKLGRPLVRFAVGDELPGDPSEPDAYALLRAGVYPDSSGVPLAVLVSSDSDAEGSSYPVSGAGYDSVVGVTSGVVFLNPVFVEAQTGLRLWYSSESYPQEGSGLLIGLAELATDSSLGSPCLCPVPGLTERPHLRIGNRRPLTPVPVDSDAELLLPASIPEGSVYWSRSTGKIVLSEADIKKGQPGEAEYQLAYLGAGVYYDGVSLNSQPLPLQNPSPCLNENGEPLDGTTAGVPLFGNLYLQRAQALPPPGASGVLYVPDGTGEIPNLIAPSVRPNGSGLRREIQGVGDTFLFSSERSIETLNIEEYENDIPVLQFGIPRTKAVTSQMAAGAQPTGYSGTSRIGVARGKLLGKSLYFLQTQVTPCVYAEEARIFARWEGPYTLTGEENLTFAIDGVSYVWSSSTLGAGTYTAQEISDSLTSDSIPALPIGVAGSLRERLFLRASSLSAGSVEIGWNSDAEDLSGQAALGLLPGWRAETPGSTFRWLPDNGATLGLYRSPENLDRTETTADIKATGQYRSKILTKDVPGTPFVSINNPPLEDVPGFDADVHFEMNLGLFVARLPNYGTTLGVGLKYDWPNNRMIWTEEGTTSVTAVGSPTSVLQLDNVGVLPETLSSEALGMGYGVYLKDVGAVGYSELTQDEDYLVPGDGGPGQVVRVHPEGGVQASGGGGEFVSGGSEFSNPDLSPDATQDADLQQALYDAVQVGFLLHVLNGDAAGLYEITNRGISSGTAVFGVAPNFPAGSTTASWQIREAEPLSVYDPTVLADFLVSRFNHLPDEPFQIRVLSRVGVVGTDPLVVQAAEALRSGRSTSLRFGLDSAGAASVTYLTKGVEIGEMAGSGLVLPDLADPHFTESEVLPGSAYFQIRIGSQVFSTALGNLVLVSSFSPVPAAGTIEVGVSGSGIDGEITPASDVLEDFEGETLYYDQLLLPGSVLSTGEAEVEVSTGETQLSDADLSTYAGKTLYYLERMVTERRTDVVISPMSGALLFNKPLREGQIVEASYSPADSAGDALLDEDGNPQVITEYLPLVVRLETATRVDGFTYTLNPTGRTLSEVVTPMVWVGAQLQNFAGVEQVTIDSESSTLTFASEVDSATTVRANYGVLEAFGGEQAYSVSTSPVYRKPFFIEKETATFSLQTDRTSELSVGKLVLIGGQPLYVKGVSYDAGEDETSVTLWPTPQKELGSRAPGIDANFLVSSGPIAIEVDPEDPVAGGGPEGFLLEVYTSETPLLPADRGQTQFIFVGDLRGHAQTGHLIEVAGYPYVIVSSDLSEDGRFTTVGVSSPLYTGYSSSDTVRISARPLYGLDPVEFKGLSPFVEAEESLLFLRGALDSSGNVLPGKLLVRGTHYESDPASGSVKFKAPNQPPLAAGETLQFFYVALETVEPVVEEEAVLLPHFHGKYLYVTVPSATNRILGATLLAQYTYSSPDSFFFETLPLSEYVGEVAEVAVQRVSGSARSGGDASGFVGETDLAAQGVMGLRSEVIDLSQQDRAARAYVEFYNEVILAFEQVLETIDGRIIGDRDGKFRFFIGRNRTYAPPGYEDPVSGLLTTRLIWREIIEEWSDSSVLLNGYFQEEDPVYNPTTAEEQDPVVRPGETDGLTPDPLTLDYFVRRQRHRVKNDMDDRLLVGLSRPLGLAALFPRIDVPGLFKDMWEAHPYSRLFPERTHHFERILPGLDAVYGATGFTNSGYFSAGRKGTIEGPTPGETTEAVFRTTGTSVGRVSNPALGDITGITDLTCSERLPRARIWAYYPDGSSELDAALSISTVGTATLVATPLPLGEFPVSGSTGFPDTSQLLFNGGALSDLASGDSELATPGFQVGQRLKFGTPQGPRGTTYELTDSGGDAILVGEVLLGCVLLLADKNGAALAGSQVLVLGTTPLADVVSDETGRGDTIFVGISVPILGDLPGDSDSPTMTQIASLGQSQSEYRVGFDISLSRRTGELTDMSFLTKQDSFPLDLQKLFGQRPPSPLMCLEGTVDFVSTDRYPLKLPALKGEAKDDSGDIQIPYMIGTKTEIALLGDVAAQFRVLMGSDSTVGLPYPVTLPVVEQQTWSAVYPDEVIAADGALYGDTLGARDPATLYSDRDCTPVATAGAYTPDSAVGDVRRFDLLLVQVGQGTILSGMTGVLSVADVSGHAATGSSYSKIEVPRFVCTALLGDSHRYTLLGAVGHLSGSFPGGSGISCSEVTAGNTTTTFDLSSIGGLELGAGAGATTGGYLALIAAGGAVVIRFYDPDPTAVTALVGALVLVGTAAGGTVYAWEQATLTSTARVLGGVGVALSAFNILEVETTATLLSVLGVTAGLFYDVMVDIDTYISAETSGFMGGGFEGTGPGSVTCSIARDRLTFSERADFTEALPRGSVPANGEATELGVQLDFRETTVGTGVTSSVNAVSETNGGVSFTLLERLGPDPDGTVFSGVPYVGTFIPGAVGSEEGKLRMMAWEGHGNTPADFSGGSPVAGIKISAMPSSDLEASSGILEGTGTIYDDSEPPMVVEGVRHWVSEVTGALGSLVTGDLLVVDEASAVPGRGAVATGTYLIRHGVDTDTADTAGTPLLQATLYADAGTAGGLDLRFPRVLSCTTAELVLENVVPVPYSPTGCGFPDPASGTTWVYLILKSQYASCDGATYTIDPEAVYRMQYNTISYNPGTGEATLSLVSTTAQNANGDALASDSDFSDAAVVRTSCSGIVFFPLTPPQSSGLPGNNVLGWEEHGGTILTAGFKQVIAGNRASVNHGGLTVVRKFWDKTTVSADIQRLLDSLLNGDVTVTVPGALGIRVPAPEDSTSFYSDKSTVVYGRRYGAASAQEDAVSGVPVNISLAGLDSATWADIHFDTTAAFANAQVLECLLPGDRILTGPDIENTSTSPGLFALSGIFLEPSFPRPTLDLAGVLPRVVSASYSLAGDTTLVGHRNVSDYTPGTASEEVHFFVRRVRRWHDVQTTIASDLEALRYGYEMRRGTYLSYDTATRTLTANTSGGAATNLGDFSDSKVNINAGDLLRVLDSSGALLDSAEIQKVGSPNTLVLRRPGLTASLATAASFEIYLEQALVPQEQSCEQLLGLVIDQTLVTRRVDYGAGDLDGGQVPSFGTLQDTLVPDWTALGVLEGDYVVVDPAGVLYSNEETGAGPLGDTSVSGRAPHVAGSPSSLDDNRGFYRVTTDPTGGDLLVDGTCRFGGGSEDGSDNVVFGGAGAEYAVLPTVGALPAEGQQALRPTAPAVAGKFLDRVDLSKSIQPFGYRIIRPSSVFSTDAVELVLFMRERMLSFIQEVHGIYENHKAGDYWDFQNEDHIESLGSPTDPGAGLGVIPNLLITSLEGLVGETPFANVSDCLSVLDRRFWILDTRLDAEGYTSFVADALSQRPVLPDLVSEVLDLEDRFRDLRFAWIKFRADRVQGSVQAARRAQESLPGELQKQKDLIAQRRAFNV